MCDLNGKTAIVTGGATRIGAAVVRALQAAGANVAVADIDEEGGRRIASELGDAVLFEPTNLRDDEQIGRLVDAAAERFGGIDIWSTWLPRISTTVLPPRAPIGSSRWTSTWSPR
jgi:NAD(P)-dependent dehydrogenase (short-subunit alcohol dehydrogenase family)